jgi:hypothetical protein
MKTKFKQEIGRPVKIVKADEIERPVDEKRRKETADSPVYGEPYDHNEWLGVLTSSSFFV